jgi:nitrous oxide reductase accessory protein NosL
MPLGDMDIIADKKEAKAFIKENGGKLANFEEVMRIAFEDLYFDTKKTRERIARQQHKEGADGT